MYSPLSQGESLLTGNSPHPKMRREKRKEERQYRTIQNYYTTIRKKNEANKHLS